MCATHSRNDTDTQTEKPNNPQMMPTMKREKPYVRPRSDHKKHDPKKGWATAEPPCFVWDPAAGWIKDGIFRYSLTIRTIA